MSDSTKRDKTTRIVDDLEDRAYNIKKLRRLYHDYKLAYEALKAEIEGKAAEKRQEPELRVRLPQSISPCKSVVTCRVGVYDALAAVAARMHGYRNELDYLIQEEEGRGGTWDNDDKG